MQLHCYLHYLSAHQVRYLWSNLKIYLYTYGGESPSTHFTPQIKEGIFKPIKHPALYISNFYCFNREIFLFRFTQSTLCKRLPFDIETHASATRIDELTGVIECVEGVGVEGKSFDVSEEFSAGQAVWSEVF